MIPGIDDSYTGVSEIRDIAGCHGGTARPGDRGNLRVELADRATEFTPPGGYGTESVRRLAVER